MREYEVRYYVDDADMVRGEKPHSEIYESQTVEAGSSVEAIDLVIDFLFDQAAQSGEFSPERDGDRIDFVDPDGEIVMQYYNFTVDSPIKAARMEAGMTQAEVRNKLRIPVRTLQDWESGKHDPPEWAEMLIVEKLERMAR